MLRTRILLVTLMRIQILLCHFDADPDPAFHFDADLYPSFLIKKVLN